MALLELPALPDVTPSAAAAQRLQELLRARFKVEVRPVRSLPFCLCKLLRLGLGLGYVVQGASAPSRSITHPAADAAAPRPAHEAVHTLNLSQDMCQFSFLVFPVIEL